MRGYDAWKLQTPPGYDAAPRRLDDAEFRALHRALLHLGALGVATRALPEPEDASIADVDRDAIADLWYGMLDMIVDRCGSKFLKDYFA